MCSVGMVVCGSVGKASRKSPEWGWEAQVKSEDSGVAGVVTVSVKVVAPEGMMGDGVEVV